jgi:pimeloyl-ACP methyl ester carboxylesterase
MKRLFLGCVLTVGVASATACASMSTSAGSSSGLAAPSDSGRVLSIDHFVRVKSAAPSMTGQFAQLYVRERVISRNVLRGASGVVLFVHGAGTPAEVAFDVPYSDYSWMGYLAEAGFDVFSMDMEGYGRSSRPTVMNDPCNLARAQQALFVPSLLKAPCAPSFQGPATTIGSDWNDIGAVVDYVRALRHVDKINLAGWSQGGPRAGGYTAQHPDQVQRLMLLAPAYARTGPDTAPAARADAVVFNTQSQKEFDANWDRQVGCSEQYDKSVSAAVWSEMVASDPVGGTWGDGVRRAPTVPGWGFNKNIVSKNQTPTLMVAGVHDKQVNPERVREYYADLGAADKVFVDLACSSHNAMWERNHLLLFQASLEWFRQGTVNGQKSGMLKIGYDTDKKNVD